MRRLRRGERRRLSELERRYDEIGEFIDETVELSPMMGSAFRELPETDRRQIVERITADGGAVHGR